jgi:opacity protein-like surface antigen
MNQKNKIPYLAAAIMIAATFIAIPKADADGSPGEGFYAGAFVGHGTGIIQADVTTTGARVDERGSGRRGTFESERGGLGLSGIQGGGWAGWGMKTADDIYFGAEASFAGSDEKIELTSSVGLQDNDGQSITSATAKRNWVGGAAVRVGYYVNSQTLFSLTGGVAVSQFDIDIGSDSESAYAGGPQVGAQVETNLSKLDPNLSLRMEFVYTDYLTADINGISGVGDEGSKSTTLGTSQITGHDSAGRIGLTYRF